MKKAVLQAVFEQFKKGGLTVRYWDGEEVFYGDSEPKVKLIFKQKPPLVASIEDPILTFGEYYMDEIIDFEGDVDEISRIVEMNMGALDQNGGKWMMGRTLKGLTSVADKLKQRHNIHDHYDLGNDFFALWLDKTMSYSCGYFKTPQDSLYDAQLQKIDLILKKLRLQQGQRLLDIGSGWGWLIIRAAQQYGVKAVGITLSEEQYAGTRERIEKLGLGEQIQVKLMNYLDLDPAKDQFDRIVSVGMFEHVGRENLPQYMKKVNELLVPQGLSMLHTITNMIEHEPNAWARKYIFPGGYVPSLRETIGLFPDYDFHLLHAESLRLHYAMTLEHWYKNFSEHLPEVEKKFGRRFVRMWTLYLRFCASSFRTSGLDIYQILFSKGLNNSLPLTLEEIYR
ncbi:MAG: cyclopropane-fatty-acyl-phospholipid synthase family protein [Veillonellales bacterium]